MKLYKSKDWLLRKHHTEKKTLKEIADICGVSEMTIRRQMQQFGIRIVK